MLKFQAKYQSLELAEGVQKCAKIWDWILSSVYNWNFRCHEKITEKLGYLVSFLLAKSDHRWRWIKFWTNATTTTPSVDGKLQFCVVFFWLFEQIFRELNLISGNSTNFGKTSAKFHWQEIAFTLQSSVFSTLNLWNHKMAKATKTFQNGEQKTEKQPKIYGPCQSLLFSRTLLQKRRGQEGSLWRPQHFCCCCCCCNTTACSKLSWLLAAEPQGTVLHSSRSLKA